ncbi:hypothetical protein [Microbacterium hatanonis]|jgi:hypothetical protein|uniref:hypothetical protein n=1 Tax=Microbacterium hatanonis TaxID=404366 RepID=UPI00164FC6CF|nr:hypothetical protein [Microbacterium hatanonis]
MTDHKHPEDAAKRETTDEGEYTDVETTEGRDTHKDDVTPGEYTDTDLGDATSR